MGQMNVERNDWYDLPTLVTGATGLLGSPLVAKLLELGADMVCVIRDWVPHSELVLSGSIKKVKVVRGDMLDRQLIERVLAEYEIDTIFHLAAQTIVGVANRNPTSTFESNIEGTWILLEACRRSPTVNRMVFTSSDKAYGEQDSLPYREDMPLRGSNPYDVSKACADLIAQAYYHTYKLPVTIPRFGNLFGGGDLNWSRIIPGTIRSIIRGRNPIIRSDGNYVRDYFYVEDAVLACLLLLEKRAFGEAFNFSYEKPMKVIEIVDLIRKMMNCNFKPIILNKVTNEIKYQYLSSAKAKQVLGWKPLYSLEEGLRRTIGWYKKFFGVK